jgi:hypothetical protein
MYSQFRAWYQLTGTQPKLGFTVPVRNSNDAPARKLELMLFAGKFWHAAECCLGVWNNRSELVCCWCYSSTASGFWVPCTWSHPNNYIKWFKYNIFQLCYVHWWDFVRIVQHLLHIDTFYCRAWHSHHKRLFLFVTFPFSLLDVFIVRNENYECTPQDVLYISMQYHTWYVLVFNFNNILLLDDMA